MKNKVYKIVTDQIIELLKQGTVPWRIPWNGNCVPLNAISKRTYSGINSFILNQTALKNDYADNRWLTFKQTQHLGGHVNRGEKATMVVFWKPVEIKEKSLDMEGQVSSKRIVPVLRYYKLFNAEQCGKLFLDPLEAPRHFDHNPNEMAENIVASMPGPPEFVKGAKASYNYIRDTVTMPPMRLFDNLARYYSTLFHELVHSTRHETRTGRDSTIPTNQNDERYSKEELIAEMGAAMLSGVTGMTDQTIHSSAAYIKNWLENLENDPTLVIKAASKAQQAVDYILGYASDRNSTSNNKETEWHQVHGAKSITPKSLNPVLQ